VHKVCFVQAVEAAEIPHNPNNVNHLISFCPNTGALVSGVDTITVELLKAEWHTTVATTTSYATYTGAKSSTGTTISDCSDADATTTPAAGAAGVFATIEVKHDSTKIYLKFTTDTALTATKCMVAKLPGLTARGTTETALTAPTITDTPGTVEWMTDTTQTSLTVAASMRAAFSADGTILTTTASPVLTVDSYPLYKNEVSPLAVSFASTLTLSATTDVITLWHAGFTSKTGTKCTVTNNAGTAGTAVTATAVGDGFTTFAAGGTDVKKVSCDLFKANDAALTAASFCSVAGTTATAAVTHASCAMKTVSLQNDTNAPSLAPSAAPQCASTAFSPPVCGGCGSLSVGFLSFAFAVFSVLY